MIELANADESGGEQSLPYRYVSRLLVSVKQSICEIESPFAFFSRQNGSRRMIGWNPIWK